ncbi:ABC transporter permease [Inquilinus sp. OTU3971]|uniref:ABC transporter permease n=1 Tax=Inquilinus sp. OTU3971 TaxID=3043855 RepID=UPI00313C6008
MSTVHLGRSETKRSSALRNLAASAASGVKAHGGLLLALVVLVVLSMLLSPYFATYPNLLNILRQLAFTGIIALGMTLVIVAGEIDISVGSAIAFASSLLGVTAMRMGLPLPLAVVLVIVAGTAVGLAGGAVRAYANVPSFIVTLALYSALRGAAYLLTNAIPIPILDPAFHWLGSGFILGLPVPAVLFLALFVVFAVIARRTTYGRSIYAIGGNADAAHLSGIPVKLVRTSLFGITGFLAAVSGVLQSARLDAGNAGYGLGVEFAVITAVIVGGASLFGGKGTMLGTLIGGVFIAVLNNAMVLIGVNSYAQYVANGAVVLLAVMVSNLERDSLLPRVLLRRFAGRSPGRPR